MRNGLLGAVSLGLLSIAAQAQMPAHVPAKDPNCDRACLEGYIDRYLVAMLEQDVSDDLFARDVKFTENGIRLPLGKILVDFICGAKGAAKRAAARGHGNQVADSGIELKSGVGEVIDIRGRFFPQVRQF